jgi:hypothetical protein
VIESGWEKKEWNTAFSVRVPANTTATFELPRGYLLDGKSSIQLAPGIYKFNL